jgi:hypothetical protein
MVYHCNTTNPSAYDKAYFETFLFKKLGSVKDDGSVADSDVRSQGSSDQTYYSCFANLEPTPPSDEEYSTPKTLNSRSFSKLEARSPWELEYLFPKNMHSLCFPPPPLTLCDFDLHFRYRSPRLIGLEVTPGNPAGRRYTNERNERVSEGLGLSVSPKSALQIARDKISAKDWKRKVEDRVGDWDGDDWGRKKEARELVERVVAKARTFAKKTRHARSIYGFEMKEKNSEMLEQAK